MIDDLITQGTTEPYRMFTSRAEYRLLLREDNADLRLTATGWTLGMVDDQRWRAFEAKRKGIVRLQAEMTTSMVKPNSPEALKIDGILSTPLQQEATLADLLRRPEVKIDHLALISADIANQSDGQILDQVEIQAKYAGYIERQQTEIDRTRRYDNWSLPEDFDYVNVVGLSNEVREKLCRTRPETLGQAARIQGVTPAAISLLLVHLKKKSA